MVSLSNHAPFAAFAFFRDAMVFTTCVLLCPAALVAQPFRACEEIRR